MSAQECLAIYERWHTFARDRDVPALLELYADDAVLESPLVEAILEDVPSGELRGRDEIARFLTEGTKRRPNELVRWYRDGRYLCDGELLFWEYPRITPDGEQIDIAEVMEVRNGRIAQHRIYWGWFGFSQLR